MALEDTHPKARARQVELMRAATPQRRFELAAEWTDTLVALSRRALRLAHPGASRAELDRLWLERQYGPAVARLMDRCRERSR